MMGVNTARSGTWKNGRLSWAQIERIRERFGALPERVFKVLVTHHPFVPVPGRSRSAPWSAAGFQALQAAEACGVDLLLAGHLHHGLQRRRARALPVHPPLDAGRPGGHGHLAAARAASPTPTTGSRSSRPHLVIEVRGWDGGRLRDAVRHALRQARRRVERESPRRSSVCSPPAQRAVEVEGGADQAEVGEGLGEVAERLARWAPSPPRRGRGGSRSPASARRCSRASSQPPRVGAARRAVSASTSQNVQMLKVPSSPWRPSGARSVS